jgi:hypothetical protein
MNLHAHFEYELNFIKSTTTNFNTMMDRENRSEINKLNTPYRMHTYIHTYIQASYSATTVVLITSGRA